MKKTRNPLNPTRELNASAVAVLHTTELPDFDRQPTLSELYDRVPGVVAAIQGGGTLLDDRVGYLVSRTVNREWVRCPLDLARGDTITLKWQPFTITQLQTGVHVDLIKIFDMLGVLQIQTRRVVPVCVDMKIHYALAKMMYGQAYWRWKVGEKLVGFPIIQGVWHPYKYCVQQVYKKFLPVMFGIEGIQGKEGPGRKVP